MKTWVFIVLVIAVILAVLWAVVAMSGTKPRVVTTNDPVQINKELDAAYRSMPTMTSQKVTLGAAASTGYRIPHDYGSATAYTSIVSWVTNGGASFDLRVVNVDGDSVHIFRTGVSGGTVNLVTVPTGVWGR